MRVLFFLAFSAQLLVAIHALANGAPPARHPALQPRQSQTVQDRGFFEDLQKAAQNAASEVQGRLSNVLRQAGLPQIGGIGAGAPALAPSLFNIPTVIQRGSEAFISFVLQANYRLGSSGPRPVATTRTGVYEGIGAPYLFNQQYWLGVPFAKAPVGDLRFRKAQALPNSNARVSADTIKPTCWQPNGYLLAFNGDDGQRSEDCLYMNIYTPRDQEKKNTKLPVLLWYFGGGEIGGAASSYNATALELLSILAGEPIVIVTPQYRVNAFGFMAGKVYSDAAKAGKVDLNPGLTDVTAALDWVSENIAAFGGDPTKITIAGQSSGAFNVGAQLLKDGANRNVRPKYRSAVMLSGTMGTEPSFQPDDAIVTKTFDRVANAVNCGPAAGDQIDCLRKANPLALAEATFPNVRAGARPDDTTLQGPDFYPGVFYYQPVKDGVYHRDGAGPQVRRGEIPDVPILTGNVKDEGTIFVQQRGQAADWKTWLAKVAYKTQDFSQPGSQEYIDRVAVAYPDIVSQGAPYWPARTSNVSRFGVGAQFERSASAIGDNGWHAARRLFLENHNKYNKSPVWSYLFNQTDFYPDTEGWIGIPHGFDPPYWFAAYAFLPNLAYLQQPATSRDVSLSFISFVRNQNPNHAGMRNWPAYTQANKQLFRFQGFNNILIDDNFRPQMSLFTEPQGLALTSR